LTNEGYCEYSTLSGSLITSVFNNGNETIHYLPAITSNPVSQIIAKTQGTTFNVGATGTGLTYLWQVSTNGGSTYTDLSNNSTYSNVASPTLSISNAQLSMSGYFYRCKVTGTCSPVVYSNGASLTVLPNIYTTCRSWTGCPGSMFIPITAVDFTGVGAFSLTLVYNPAVLTFTGTSNLNSALASGNFVANANGGKVYLSWSNIAAATITNNDTLVRLLFTAAPGTTSLNWDTQTTGNCEYSDPNGLIIFSTWINGSATVHTPPSVTSHPVAATTYGGGSAGFTVTAAGTGLTYQWQVSTNGGSSYANLTNVAPYSGVYTNALWINPATTSMNGYLYRCVVSGTCTPSVNSNSAMLTVTQNAITTFPTAITNSCTGNVSIPINVTNCNNVGGISLTLIYDTTKMSYEGYHSVNAALSGGIIAVNRVANKVYFTWASMTALNLGSGVLLQYRFRANAAISTTLSWDTQTTGACEYSDINGQLITAVFNTSTVSTVSNALIVNAGPDQIKTGASVQLNGTATGSTPPYTWLWSPAASLSNPAIANPVATPAASTTYTLTVTAAGCSGVDLMDVIVTGPPENLSVQNVNVPNGTSNCYNATNTITVAGGGTTFTVQSGGSALFIAGMKISYLSGTRVYSGGYMRGYITTNGQYCTNPTPPVMANPLSADELVQPVLSSDKIYPNPTTGLFTVKSTDEQAGVRKVRCYNIMGKLIFEEEFDAPGESFTLEGQPSGMYILHFQQGENYEILKIVKQ
jgi:hypothetical protein